MIISVSANVIHRRGVGRGRGGKGGGLTGDGLVDPKSNAFEDSTPDLLTHHRGREKLPISLRVQMSAVEGEAIALPDDIIPVALHLVDVLGDEA